MAQCIMLFLTVILTKKFEKNKPKLEIYRIQSALKPKCALPIDGISNFNCKWSILSDAIKHQ